MRTSDSIKELAAALAKAQGDIKPAAKDSENPHFKSKYADLAAVVEVCRQPLFDNGLSIAQEVRSVRTETGFTVEVTTLLMHASGEFIETVTPIPVQQNTAHGIGSAATYGRRYGYAAMVGVVADVDDDGNEATEKPKPKKPQEPGKEQTVNYVTQLTNTLKIGAGCNTPEQALAVLKIIIGDTWTKLPKDCTQDEAKAAWEKVKDYAKTVRPLHELNPVK